jgi:membrane fusion protein (multidrug efflux system)
MAHEPAAPRHDAVSPTKSGKTERWWKHPRTFKVFAGVVLLGFVALTVWWFAFRPYVSTDDARVDATMIKLAPSGAGGRVAAVTVEEGDRVTKGQVLVRLDDRQARAELQRARAQANEADVTLKRMQNLITHHGVSQASLDGARYADQAAHAELALAQTALDDCVLKSPVDGMVVQRWTDPGDFLATGQAAVSVTDVDHAWVEANIQETEAGLVKPGQPVSIDVDEGGHLTGKVKDVLNATASQFSLLPAQNTSGNFVKLVQRIPIRITLDPHPGQTLTVGQSVEVRIRVR